MCVAVILRYVWQDSFVFHEIIIDVIKDSVYLSNHNVFFLQHDLVYFIYNYSPHTFSVLPLLQTRHGQYEEERNDESLHSQ